MVDLPLVGGCQCGALRYQVSAAPVMVYNCHCTNCQKIGGGAFSTPVTILEAGFSFTKGEPARMEWTADSGAVRYGWYCHDCGSRIAHGQVKSKGMLSLRGGTLDDVSWVEPVADIWAKSAQKWVVFDDSRFRFEEQPTDYTEIVAAFAKQGHFAS